jgi:murein DD-endopeptidase MepM/ murein hydrolase activator NlpD
MNNLRRNIFILTICMLLSSFIIATSAIVKGNNSVDNISKESISLTIEDPIDLIHSSLMLKSGDNLASLLARNKVTDDEVGSILSILGHIVELKRMPVRTSINLVHDNTGLKTISLELPKAKEIVKLDRTGDLLFVASTIPIEIDTILIRHEGVVQSSFYEAFIGSGGTAELAIKFFEIFQYAFYFPQDTRDGDKYYLISEELHRDGVRIGYGKILTASYFGIYDTLTAVWRPTPESSFGGEYFDDSGQSFRRDLLRVPFSAARISSTYGVRIHPVTGQRKMHRGVDLRAKRGTPVVSAGQGTVTKIGRGDPGLGNWVHVKHPRGFETRYGHFQSIARGIKKGVHVDQGDVIGYVGSTGRTTGPHLHYEVFRDGHRINPMKVRGSPVQQLNETELACFMSEWYDQWTSTLFNPGSLPNDNYFGPLPEQLELVMQ